MNNKVKKTDQVVKQGGVKQNPKFIPTHLFHHINCFLNKNQGKNLQQKMLSVDVI